MGRGAGSRTNLEDRARNPGWKSSERTLELLELIDPLVSS